MVFWIKYANYGDLLFVFLKNTLFGFAKCEAYLEIKDRVIYISSTVFFFILLCSLLDLLIFYANMLSCCLGVEVK